MVRYIYTLSQARTHDNTHHTQVLRSVTAAVREDSDLLSTFASIPHPSSFCDKDVDSVFQKYTARVETLFGNEVSRQLMEKLKKSKASCLESLRQLRNKKRKRVKEDDLLE